MDQGRVVVEVIPVNFIETPRVDKDPIGREMMAEVEVERDHEIN